MFSVQYHVVLVAVLMMITVYRYAYCLYRVTVVYGDKKQTGSLDAVVR
jgi:hypothetical protein